MPSPRPLPRSKKKLKAAYGYALIGRPIRFTGKLPFRISPKLVVARPTEAQIQRIRKYLFGLYRFDDLRRPYEERFSQRPYGKVGDIPVVLIDSKRLPKALWKYTIIKYRSDFSGSIEHPSLDLFDFNLAATIAHKKLHLLRTFHNRGYWGWGSDTEHFDYLQSLSRDESEEFWTAEDLNLIKAIYQQIHEVRTSHPQLYHSLRLFASLPRVVGYNELLCLGLFAVVESVLTHNPRGDSDSISHQIATKVTLLSNRFKEEIDYSSFAAIDRTKLWKKLYDFRSKLAHGGTVDFRGSHQVLKDSFTVQTFLEEFLGALLRHAINEPQLYVDLKEC